MANEELKALFKKVRTESIQQAKACINSYISDPEQKDFVMTVGRLPNTSGKLITDALLTVAAATYLAGFMDGRGIDRKVSEEVMIKVDAENA